ncbi:MAG: RHS repeat-associated core domain-containing protein [Oscillospiraceae bacterium]|nr:RHS repeat-associated core domain-containing protein [Oscillospiraceae bacterium]
MRAASYLYGDSNWKDKLTSYDGKAITYDSIGNRTSYDGYTYTWQRGRQLAGISGNGLTASYTYDADGIRTSKTVNGVEHTYLLNGTKVLKEVAGEDILWYDYDAAGNILAMTLNGTTYYYEKNVQGDIIGLIDDTGANVVSYLYDSWGKLVSTTGTLADTVGVKNPYRYRGYRYDTETGLYYLQSRYYDPDMKKFINADEIVDTGSSVLSTNMFAYCENNPVAREDSGGAFWETVFDVISLSVSIVEVCANPTDPWAWAGLVGDAIDLIPFVSGVGEVTRIVKTAVKVADKVKDVVKATVKIADKADDVIGAAKDIYKAADKASDIRKATGSYEIIFESGKNYVGKGGFKRAIQSAKRYAKHDVPTSIRWKSAPNQIAAFIDEYLMQAERGVLHWDDKAETYNKIWSPGKKLLGK